MDEIVERIEHNFINIYKKFDILDIKLNDYHMKFDKINEIIDLIISDEYYKIHKTYFPMKNYDLTQDRFFIYNKVIDVPLKKNSYIIFEYIFESEYINIPLVINLKIDDVLEKKFDINFKKNNEVRYMFKLDYNITKINFYLYLYNNEIYNDEKMEYLKKILFNNKKLNLIYFLLYRHMNYYRKPIDKTINDVKLKMQMAAFTLKLSENNDKIDDLLKADKDIKKDITDNSNSIKNFYTKQDVNNIISQYYLKKNIDSMLNNYYLKSNIDNKINDRYDKNYIDNNYYNKNYIDILSSNVYNRTHLDNQFNNIYNKTETNDKISKLDRNIVLFNTNLTKFIDETYKNNKEILEGDIKENKDNLNNFIINTF